MIKALVAHNFAYVMLNNALLGPLVVGSQVSAWQSATLLPVSCNSVEEPVSPEMQSSSGGATNEKAGC